MNESSKWRSGLACERVGLFLPSGSSTADGAIVQQWSWKSGANQQWSIVPLP